MGKDLSGGVEIFREVSELSSPAPHAATLEHNPDARCDHNGSPNVADGDSLQQLLPTSIMKSMAPSQWPATAAAVWPLPAAPAVLSEMAADVAGWLLLAGRWYPPHVCKTEIVEKCNVRGMGSIAKKQRVRRVVSKLK